MLHPDALDGRAEPEGSARCSEDASTRAEAHNAAGVAYLIAGQSEAAADRFAAALRADPDHVHARLHLAVLLDRAGQPDRAVAEYTRAMASHRADPGDWPPAVGRDVARLGLIAEQRDPRPTYAVPPDRAGPGPPPWITVVVGCYGPFPGYSVRALDSVAAGEDLRRHCDLLIGLNRCCAQTRSRARAMVDGGLADGLVESGRNLNKDPILRALLEQVRTPYLLWLDDDSHFAARDWPAAFAALVAAEHPFDVAGQAARWGPDRMGDPEYAEFIRARPWWREPGRLPASLREWCPFVPGGLFLARTDFLRRHDFPDRGMIKAMDDVALGELVLQAGGRTVYLGADLLGRVRVSDGHRRGENFELSDGWNRGPAEHAPMTRTQR